jgi:polysaccharide pyruvyl transferase WcaK-like protein
VFMRDNKLEEKKFVCVIIRYPSDEVKYHDPTGGSVPQSRKDSHMKKLSSFIARWIESTGMKVLICPETRDSIGQAKKHLYSKLPGKIKENCVFMNDFWTSEQAYSVFRSSCIVVSMEMHSIIMSLNVGTPVVHNPFAEAGRKKWMMKDTGFEDWLVDIDDDGDAGLFEAAALIHDNYDFAQERIKGAMKLLEAKALCTVTEIKGAWQEKKTA